MEQIFSNTTYSINQLIEMIDSGDLGLPELQRPFIWKDAKVRDLFDSLMKGYPVGYLMLWDCPTFEKKKTIGEVENKEPKTVIIDGQQRLTSLYAVITGKKVKDENYQERNIIISYNPLINKFEVGYQATKNDKEWIYNISELFGSHNFTFISKFINVLEESRKSKGYVLTNEEKTIIADNIQEVVALTKQKLSVVSIKANVEEEDVSEIFVRVNSAGISLKQNDFILTLLSLYWDEGRTYIESFCKESLTPSKETTAFNQITSVSPQDVIRTLMAYAFSRARLKYGYKLLRGADFDKKGVIDLELRDERFTLLKEKLPDVLNVHYWHEYLKCIKNAGYLSGDLISSETTIFYNYALYLIAKDRFDASYNDNMLLTSQFFYYSSLVSLFTGSFESTMEGILNSVNECQSFDDYKNLIHTKIKEALTDDFFKITLCGSNYLAVSGKGNPSWYAYCAALNILKSGVLFSKTSMITSQLYEIGTDGNRKSLEKHHLFPKKYLKSLGYSDSRINQMANYAYIDWKDNMEILDEAPSVYYSIICQGRTSEEIKKMEAENALPHGWETMTYDDFLIERRKLMAAKIKEGFDFLIKQI